MRRDALVAESTAGDFPPPHQTWYSTSPPYGATGLLSMPVPVQEAG